MYIRDEYTRKKDYQDDDTASLVSKRIPFLVLDCLKNYNKGQGGSFSAFQTSLQDQFSQLNFKSRKPSSLNAFLQDCLYGNDVDFITEVCFYSPSYNKNKDLSKAGIEYLNNIFVRKHFNRFHDVIFIGDIVLKKSKEGVSNFHFVVRGLSLTDPGTSHYGEKPVRCCIVCKIMDGLDESYLNPSGRICFGYPPKSVYLQTVFDDSLIGELSRTYIVPNSDEVVGTLDDWTKFLNESERKLKSLNGRRFMISRYRFISAYKGPISIPHDPKRVVDSNIDFCWTEQSDLPGFNPCLVLHIEHVAKNKDCDKSYIEAFNRLTATSVKVSRFTFDETDFDEDDNNPLRRIGEGRIAEPRIYSSDPVQELSELEEKYRARFKEVTNQVNEEYEQELQGELDRYTHSSDFSVELQNGLSSVDLEAIIDDEIQTQIDDAMAAIRLDFSKAKRIFESSPSEESRAAYLDMLSRYDRKAIETTIDKSSIRKKIQSSMEQEISEKLIAERKQRLHDENRDLLDYRLKHHQDELEEEYAGQKESLVSEKGYKTFKVNFEILLEGEDPLKAIERRSVLFKGSQALTIDDTGSMTVITRQKKALEAFANGNLVNPFLSVYLFNPESMKYSRPKEITQFYNSRLNQPQKQAIRDALGSTGVYLIQGPPGTGKTQVISEIAVQLAMRNKKVLISSQNNKAVDNAFSRLYRSPLIRPLRLISDEKENNYSLDKLTENFYEGVRSALESRLKYLSDDSVIEESKRILSAIVSKNKELKAVREEVAPTFDTISSIEKGIMELRGKINKASSMESEAEANKERLNINLEYARRFETSGLDSDTIMLIRNAVNSDRKSSFKDSSIFGPKGIASIVTSLTPDQIRKCQDVSRKNIDYEYYLQQVNNSRDEKSRATAQFSLDSYLNRLGLERSDFILTDLFGRNVPSDLINMARTIREVHRAQLEKIEKQIDKCQNVRNIDTAEMESDLQYQQETLDELISSPKLEEYYASESSLYDDVRYLMNSLQVTKVPEDIDDAISLINAEIEIREKMPKADREMLLDAFSDILGALEDEEVISADHNSLTSELFLKSNVIGMTCTASNRTENKDLDIDTDLSKMGVDVVIVDEVSKVPFSELVMPLAYGKSAILVGDHKQLPPVYIPEVSNEISKDDPIYKMEYQFKEMYERPLFKILFQRTPEFSKMMLKVQYRMSRPIMDIDNIFYDNMLECGCDEADKRHYLEIDGRNGPIISERDHVLFVDCNGVESLEKGATSFTNSREAAVAAQLIRLIDHNCVLNAFGQPLGLSPESQKLTAGVICTYAAQSKLIRDKLKDERFTAFKGGDDDERFMVKSVDDFQGDERDIIILSLVRTKGEFIRDFRRINVAMSRARRLLIILGNSEQLSEISVRLEDSVGTPFDSCAYGEIIKRIKLLGGFRTYDDIIGEDEL